MKKILLIIAVLFSVSTMAQVKPSEMSAATKMAFKTALQVQTQAEADLRYPQIADADPTPIYTAAEVDALLSNKEINSWILGLQLAGSTAKVAPLGAAINSMFSANVALSLNRPYQVLFAILKPTTITGVLYMMQTAGAYTVTGTYNGFVLSSVSGVGVHTEITRTVDDANCWTATANALTTKAFAAPQTLAAGLYSIQYIWSYSAQTIAPVLFGFSALSTNASLLLGNSNKFAAYDGVHTVITNSIASSSLTTSNNLAAIFLY